MYNNHQNEREYNDKTDYPSGLAAMTAGAENLSLREYTARSGADFLQAAASINASRAGGTYRVTLTGNIRVSGVIFTDSDAEKTVIIQGDVKPRAIVNNSKTDLLSVT
jgi:hypothetical protein